ncbi:MAG: hypothetical protein IJA34_06660 [Lachnospiraceae bacterium]|nr:hypothetical protein [Lachnospiraceae bacterium]
MRQMVEKIWELLECNIKEMNKKSQDVILNYEAHDRFYDYFKELYAEIKKNYMKNEVKNLDRHKVSGIIIVTIIKSDVIQYKGKMEENYIFFGKYVIATSVAITYMQDRLNEKILDKGEKIIYKLKFPKNLSYEYSYFEMFCRNLYFADINNKWGLNPLDIAEKLFLLEYISLIEDGKENMLV